MGERELLGEIETSLGYSQDWLFAAAAAELNHSSASPLEVGRIGNSDLYLSRSWSPKERASPPSHPCAWRALHMTKNMHCCPYIEWDREGEEGALQPIV